MIMRYAPAAAAFSNVILKVCCQQGMFLHHSEPEITREKKP